MRREWTVVEAQTMCELWPTRGSKALATMLGRSTTSVHRWAQRNGLKRVATYREGPMQSHGKRVMTVHQRVMLYILLMGMKQGLDLYDANFGGKQCHMRNPLGINQYSEGVRV